MTPERFYAGVARVFPRQVRLWLYGVGVAAVPLSTIYGVMTVEQGGAWLAFAGAALGGAELGMAALNARKPK